ncbi:MAG: hypothetical protein KDK44_01230 [Chlamydiia bacterium]|nr:hypothetical protein [Chlamydiia bacterium]
MSLPIVIIFERHYDELPKSLINGLLPDLNKKGYGTFCFEAPQNLSSAEIIDRHSSGLKFDTDLQQQAEQLLKQVGIVSQLSDMSFSSLAELLRLYVSSQGYLELAEKIKRLPASRILKEVFDQAAKLDMSISGVDIDSEDYDKMMSHDLSGRMSRIRLREDHRITTIFQNLLKLRSQQQEGVIFACGALHAKGLIDKFKKYGLQDEVLYYFPHSSSCFDERVDDIKELAKNETLVNHTYLLAEEDIKPFGQKIIRNITDKTRYKKEILDSNSHSQFLRECFKTNIRCFLRPGYHLDAFVDITEPSDIADIQRRVNAVGVQTHNVFLDGRSYLVIPNVNTNDIGQRIRKISS